MNTLTRRLFAVFVFLSLAIPHAAPAEDNAPEIAALRSQQAALAAERDLLRERADVMEAQIAEGRTVFVYLPLEGFDAWQMVTESDALGTFTTEYLQRIVDLDRPFSSDDLAAYIKARRDTARDLAQNLKNTIADFRARAERIDADWKRLEAQIAALSAQPDTPPAAPAPLATSKGSPPAPQPASSARACVEAAGVERLFDLANDANVASGAAVHSAVHSGMSDGRPTDGALDWTAPPLRLCDGDTFVIEMNAGNSAPLYESSKSHIANVSVHPTTAAIEVVGCSNPPIGFGQSNNSAAVKTDMTGYTNTCTYKVVSVGAPLAPKGMIAADLSASPAFGKVTYLYVAP